MEGWRKNKQKKEWKREIKKKKKNTIIFELPRISFSAKSIFHGLNKRMESVWTCCSRKQYICLMAYSRDQEVGVPPIHYPTVPSCVFSGQLLMAFITLLPLRNAHGERGLRNRLCRRQHPKWYNLQLLPPGVQNTTQCCMRGLEGALQSQWNQKLVKGGLYSFLWGEKQIVNIWWCWVFLCLCSEYTWNELEDLLLLQVENS